MAQPVPPRPMLESNLNKNKVGGWWPKYVAEHGLPSTWGKGFKARRRAARKRGKGKYSIMPVRPTYSPGVKVGGTMSNPDVVAPWLTKRKYDFVMKHNPKQLQGGRLYVKGAIPNGRKLP